MNSLYYNSDQIKAMVIAERILKYGFGVDVEYFPEQMRTKYTLLTDLPCPPCKKSGQVQVIHQDDQGNKLDVLEMMACPLCSGRGTIEIGMNVLMDDEFMMKLLKG